MASFTVNSAEFLNAISSIFPIVPSKPPRDILKCFRIKAVQGREESITIYATDLETFATSILKNSVIVHTPGDFVVPAAILLEYARSLDGGTTTLVTQEAELKITEGEAQLGVGLQDLDEFPEFPELPDSATYYPVPLAALSKALSQVIFAVADKGSPRWGTLNAVCMETEGQEVSLIGTDQHRASVVSMEVTSSLSSGNYLIPSKTLALVPKIFNNEEVNISFDSSNNLILSDGSSTVMIRLLSGSYPPVKDFVPDHPNSIDIDAGAFLKQVKKSALATDNHSSLKLELTNDKIKLFSKTRQQRKTVKVEFPLTYGGDTFEFAINCKYLLDMLKAANNGEPLKMFFNQNNQPILFTQDSFKHLIVPQVV